MSLQSVWAIFDVCFSSFHLSCLCQINMAVFASCIFVYKCYSEGTFSIWKMKHLGMTFKKKRTGSCTLVFLGNQLSFMKGA